MVLEFAATTVVGAQYTWFSICKCDYFDCTIGVGDLLKHSEKRFNYWYVEHDLGVVDPFFPELCCNSMIDNILSLQRKACSSCCFSKCQLY